MSLEEYTARYAQLRKFLTSFFAENGGAVSGRAKDKLSRLSQVQFSELCKDVSDEINRRAQDPMELPFLPVRTDFPQKRNQARQKLATLAVGRFQELACEIFYEIERRYPQIAKQYDSSTLGIGSSGLRSANQSTGFGSFNDSNSSSNRSGSSPTRLPPRGISRPPNRRQDDSLERNSRSNNGWDNVPRERERERDRDRDRERDRDEQRRHVREREPRDHHRGGSAEDAPIPQAPIVTGISREEYDRIKTDMARMKSDYELEISELKQKVIDAPSGEEYRKIHDDNKLLVADLKEEREISIDLQKKLNRLQEDYDKKSDSLEDMKRKLRDYEDRIDQLIGDMEHLTAENAHLKETLQESEEKVKQLKESESKWTDYEKVGGVRRESIMDATIKMSPGNTGHKRLDSAKSDLYGHGPASSNKSDVLDVIEDNTEALLDAAYETDPTEVLLCMKKLLVNTKEITERANEMEPRVRDDRDFQDLAQAKDDTTDAIASVMELAKAHAASGNKNSPLPLEDEVDHLISCVHRLVGLMNKL